MYMYVCIVGPIHVCMYVCLFVCRLCMFECMHDKPT